MQNIEKKCDCFPHGEIQTERGTIRINFLEYKELVHSGVCAHLGDVLDLGEPEGHAKASEEHGDERAGVVEGREAEFPAVGVHPARQLLERLRHHRERRLHPMQISKHTYHNKGSSGTRTMHRDPNPSQIYRNTRGKQVEGGVHLPPGGGEERELNGQQRPVQAEGIIAVLARGCGRVSRLGSRRRLSAREDARDPSRTRARGSRKGRAGSRCRRHRTP